jgi:hypothetical protein
LFDTPWTEFFYEAVEMRFCCSVRGGVVHEADSDDELLFGLFIRMVEKGELENVGDPLAVEHRRMFGRVLRAREERAEPSMFDLIDVSSGAEPRPKLFAVLHWIKYADAKNAIGEK